ncbi:hypothetical protein CEXT_369861 [Caerostris extrusa]|uniref:Ribosomal protein L2 n=1 Tax=Caerostris extrusa TaxID=172846 RepID=A0AAV4UPC3_CAEEX|nr:hypothetical protein CEXT_369861 [Caerostris extrusa]
MSRSVILKLADHCDRTSGSIPWDNSVPYWLRISSSGRIAMQSFLAPLRHSNAKIYRRVKATPPSHPLGLERGGGWLSQKGSRGDDEKVWETSGKGSGRHAHGSRIRRGTSSSYLKVASFRSHIKSNTWRAIGSPLNNFDFYAREQEHAFLFTQFERGKNGQVIDKNDDEGSSGANLYSFGQRSARQGVHRLSAFQVNQPSSFFRK